MKQILSWIFSPIITVKPISIQKTRQPPAFLASFSVRSKDTPNISTRENCPAREPRNMPMNMENIEWISQLYEEKPDFETGILALCLMLAEIEDTSPTRAIIM
jgi:hypothetical protein